MNALLVALLLVPRPVLSGAERTLATVDGAFLIHSTDGGVDAVLHPEDPLAVEAGLETVYSHWVKRVGMRAPLGDGALGGDARIDVYLRRLDGPRGNTWPEDAMVAGGVGSAWIELDPRSALKSSARLSAAAGHEAHHAIEYAYSTTLERWVYEATAAYVENADFAGMQAETDAHHAAILAHPEVPIDTIDGSHEYDEMAFIRGVVERFGSGPARDENVAALWDAMAEKGDAPAGIESWWSGSLTQVLLAYGVWLPATCARKDALPGTCHSQAPLRIIGLPLRSVTEVPLRPLSLAWVRVATDGACGPVTLRSDRGDEVAFATVDRGASLVSHGPGAVEVRAGDRIVVARGRSQASTVTLGAEPVGAVDCDAGAGAVGETRGCQCAVGGIGTGRLERLPILAAVLGGLWAIRRRRAFRRRSRRPGGAVSRFA